MALDRVVGRHAKRERIGNYTGIFGWGEDNVSVYERCLGPDMNVVLDGGVLSFFCYGHTGDIL